MANLFTCKYCGKEYTSRKKTSVYCSRECRRDDKCILVTCHNCGKELYKARSTIKENQKHFYCSKECQNRGQDMRAKKICEYCGKEYFIGHCFKDIQRFCSRDCFDAYRQENKKYELRECPICLNKFYPKTDATIYCSNKCKSLSNQKRIVFNCENCGVEVVDRVESEYYKSAHHFCSWQCRGEYYNWTKSIDLVKYIRYKLKSWRSSTMEALGYKCLLTGNTENLVIHHCKGFNIIFNETIDKLSFDTSKNFYDYTQDELNDFYNTFMEIQEKDKAYVCITEDIHRQFHSKYGYGNNNVNQWDDFVNNYYKKV